ncbi:hypothetical protein KAM478_29260 [Aeromonas caviae]|nr:hypothetical protein KAM462_18540 [Aeromonas caviae]GKR10575.1 hypothetical protein KAM465_21520 [Aeromonas caviae]GKR15451.1 hypothetical protein KAM466_27690 [Aeromonas caviae]GKR24164.1 hypothetical protein KAM468_29040 [Aeromonas caviae]GKR32796.1 hypothetical protein KAM470_28690 [Aeromonas caviae]
MTWRLPAWAWKPVRLASMSKVASGEKIFMVTSLWVKSAALSAHDGRALWGVPACQPKTGAQMGGDMLPQSK